MNETISTLLTTKIDLDGITIPSPTAVTQMVKVGKNYDTLAAYIRRNGSLRGKEKLTMPLTRAMTAGGR